VNGVRGSIVGRAPVPRLAPATSARQLGGLLFQLGAVPAVTLMAPSAEQGAEVTIETGSRAGSAFQENFLLLLADSTGVERWHNKSRQ